MNSLYFIAITPDDKVSKEVIGIKNHMAVKYSSKAALTSPPHITLYPPFKWEEQNENSIIESLNDFVQKKNSFSIALNGFGCFKPRVIFINPEVSEKLNELQKDLLQHLKTTINLHDQQNERPYHPHMTIATRDLQKKYFYEAWEEFNNKNFSAEFNVRSIILLKHNGKSWNIYEAFYFSQ
jgi:2'-5' RNA ligase